MVRQIAEVHEEVETEEALQEMLLLQHPIGRLGEPDDIANGIRFLITDESSFMTGSELVIDGGESGLQLIHVHRVEFNVLPFRRAWYRKRHRKQE